MRLLTTLFFFFFITATVYSQSVVKGQVIDYQTKKGIGDCNIYLSGTSKGTFSNAKGFFEITGVPDGIYEVVFSHVSYKAHVQIIEVKGQDVSIKSSLATNPTALTTVEVVNEKDKARRRKALKKFKDFFFGKQYQEASIYIKNEDIIDLSKEKNGVITSKNPYSLQVTNEYLGYDLEYYVQEFLLSSSQNMVLGFPKFSEKQTENPTKKLVWLENRQRSYNGSLRHFFASLIDGTLTEQGFEAYISSDDPEVLEEEEPGAEFYADRAKQRYLVDAKKLPLTITIDNTEFENIKRINFGQVFDVNYTKEFGRVSGYQNSKMKLVQDYVYVYTNGIVVNPSALKLFGRWADEGAYELLPYDYVSNDTLELNDNLKRQERLAELNQLVQEQPKEKIYLHTNRSDYYPDETLWFKAYVVAGPTHQPSPLSHNIYVDLIAPNQRVVKHMLLASKEGFAHGYIDLDKKLRRGKYMLQAYTEGMKGESSQYFFRKEIEVNDILDREKPKLNAKDLDLQLFPESGNLISEVAAVVAFKATDEFGMPVEVKGKVYSTNSEGEDRKEVAELTTLHDGMGSFTLTPEEGRSYYVLTDQNTQRYELPTVKSTGVSMIINNVSNDEYLNVKVQKNAQTKAEESFLIGHSRGWLNYTASAEFRGEQAIDIKIYKKDLREGINHLTLFDKRGKPIAERLFYIRHQNGLNVSLTTEQETYQKREITKVNIKVTDENGAPVEGNFSMTAFNQDRVSTASPNDHIVSNLLLNSDLKGYIHHPAYYFEKLSPTKDAHLDLVMMTNGWTRFQWEELKEMTKKVPEIDYAQRIDIKGRMLIEGRNKPVKSGTVTYINNNAENPETLVATTNRDGEFVIEDASPLEGKLFLLKGNTAKNKDFVEFKLDTIIRKTPGSPNYREVTLKEIVKTEEGLDEDPSLKATFITKDNKDFLSNLQILETVVVEAEKEAPKRISLYGPPSTSLELAPIVRDYSGTNVFRFLKGRISGVVITDNDIATSIEIRNNISSGGAIVGNGSTDSFENPSSLITSDPQNPILLLDNVPVTIEVIVSLPADIIERVEVFKGPDAIAFGSNGGNGAILFFTKPGYDPAAYIQSKGIESFTVNGYHVVKEFYQPKYDASYKETGVSDYRIAIHWEPVVKTDEKGEASVSFYNSDDKDRIKVILEGISLTGIPGIGSMSYKVDETQN